MADTAPTPAPAPPPRSRRRLLLIAAGVAALALVGAGAYLFLGSGAPAAAEAPASPPPTEEGAVLEVTTLTANLAGPDLRYARVGFAAVLAADAAPDAVEDRLPLLTDAALTVLGSFSAEDLLASGGRDRLRTELTAQAHDLWPDGEVLRVVLTELTVQ